MSPSVRMRVVKNNTLLLAGAPVFTGTSEDLDRRLKALCAIPAPTLVVTPNVDQVIDLGRSQAFQSVYDSADLRLLDGMPLVLLARHLGHRDARRYTGADLLPAVVRMASETGWRIAITGGPPDVSDRAARKLSASNGADVVSVDFPFIQKVSDPRGADVVAELTRLRPAVVFLCLGAPKQELWFAHWRAQLPAAVYVGAGASAAFASGDLLRAPIWMQRVGLEWIWRFSCEPRRLGRRYFIKGPRFLPIIARSLVTRMPANSRVDSERPARDGDGKP